MQDVKHDESPKPAPAEGVNNPGNQVASKVAMEDLSPCQVLAARVKDTKSYSSPYRDSSGCTARHYGTFASQFEVFSEHTYNLTAGQARRYYERIASFDRKFRKKCRVSWVVCGILACILLTAILWHGDAELWHFSVVVILGALSFLLFLGSRAAKSMAETVCSAVDSGTPLERIVELSPSILGNIRQQRMTEMWDEYTKKGEVIAREGFGLVAIKKGEVFLIEPSRLRYLEEIGILKKVSSSVYSACGPISETSALCDGSPGSHWEEGIKNGCVIETPVSGHISLWRREDVVGRSLLVNTPAEFMAGVAPAPLDDL